MAHWIKAPICWVRGHNYKEQVLGPVRTEAEWLECIKEGILVKEVFGMPQAVEEFCTRCGCMRWLTERIARNIRARGPRQMDVPTIRISLSEEDFAKLVSGEIIICARDTSRVEISLRDIGFHRMHDALMNAVEKIPTPKPENPDDRL